MEDHAKSRIGTEVFAKFLERAPAVGKPAQYRNSGPDPKTRRDHARDLAALLSTEPRRKNITLDGSEPARVARVVLDQDKLR